MAKKKLSLREILEEEKRLKLEKEKLITDTYITVGKKFHQLIQLDNSDIMIDELSSIIDKQISQKKAEIKAKKNEADNSSAS